MPDDKLRESRDTERCVCMGGTEPCVPPFGPSGGCSLSDDTGREGTSVRYIVGTFEGRDAVLDTAGSFREVIALCGVRRNAERIAASLNAVHRIASRRPSQDAAAQAFFRSRRDVKKRSDRGA